MGGHRHAGAGEERVPGLGAGQSAYQLSEQVIRITTLPENRERRTTAAKSCTQAVYTGA